MDLEKKYLDRFEELIKLGNKVMATKRSIQNSWVGDKVDNELAHEWGASCLNLLNLVFGESSIFVEKFDSDFEKFDIHTRTVKAFGVFKAAFDDYKNGFYKSVKIEVTRELFGDFVNLAKTSLAKGYKDVAAVLACASLEDSLKRFAKANNLDVDNQDMITIVNALKAEGLVSGARKVLLDTMPKLRDFAMHANWDKITSEDVGSIIGFVEQFLIQHF